MAKILTGEPLARVLQSFAKELIDLVDDILGEIITGCKGWRRRSRKSRSGAVMELLVGFGVIVLVGGEHQSAHGLLQIGDLPGLGGPEILHGWNLTRPTERKKAQLNWSGKRHRTGPQIEKEAWLELRTRNPSKRVRRIVGLGGEGEGRRQNEDDDEDEKTKGRGGGVEIRWCCWDCGRKE